ncbi:hypothetical protein M407DRAFT_81169 [Tulasnella calospora MUT 4182]|uniref:Poly [ADP-ribose] polymerase n=1 Tax=Tulasnella calospora MUT 4182 TaxID=1051891 RepID=A0A0C3KGZ0_9AGAM|nr:hypothetical protein M407DRAFT_81169 [Tulasnella calospora MUT 4182]
MSPGNERRRWHGTKRFCKIGDDPDDASPCDHPNCALCSILSSSFQVGKVKSSGRKFSRFGAGIYASSVSSKADDYSTNVRQSSYKAMLLTTVVVGRGYKLTRDKKSLTCPPEGYHSVLGEVGDTLNYDEVVVYDDDAIRPSWLVVYQ